MAYSEKYRIWMEKREEIVKNLTHLTCGICGILKLKEEFNKSAINHSVKPPCKCCSSVLGKISYRKHILKNLLRLAKHRALRKGIEFSITEIDIKIPEFCPLLGIPIIIGRKGKAQSDNSPNIDRIDPSKGYVKGNVWVVSSRANRIKYNSTLEELELICSNLRKNLLESLKL